MRKVKFRKTNTGTSTIQSPRLHETIQNALFLTLRKFSDVLGHESISRSTCRKTIPTSILGNSSQIVVLRLYARVLHSRSNHLATFQREPTWLLAMVC